MGQVFKAHPHPSTMLCPSRSPWPLSELFKVSFRASAVVTVPGEQGGQTPKSFSSNSWLQQLLEFSSVGRSRADCSPPPKLLMILQYPQEIPEPLSMTQGSMAFLAPSCSPSRHSFVYLLVHLLTLCPIFFVFVPDLPV